MRVFHWRGQGVRGCTSRVMTDIPVVLLRATVVLCCQPSAGLPLLPQVCTSVLNDDHESVTMLVKIHSHSQMIYTISMITRMPSFPVVCLCVQPQEDSVQGLTVIPK
jgi:hypothetical protein